MSISTKKGTEAVPCSIISCCKKAFVSKTKFALLCVPVFLYFQILFSFSDTFFAFGATNKSFLPSKSTSTKYAAGNKLIAIGVELDGNAGSEEIINEFVFGAVPPFINKFMFEKATSPITKSITPEPS